MGLFSHKNTAGTTTTTGRSSNPLRRSNRATTQQNTSNSFSLFGTRKNRAVNGKRTHAGTAGGPVSGTAGGPLASHHSKRNPGLSGSNNVPPTLGQKLKGKKYEVEGLMHNDARLMRQGQKMQI